MPFKPAGSPPPTITNRKYGPGTQLSLGGAVTVNCPVPLTKLNWWNRWLMLSECVTEERRTIVTAVMLLAFGVVTVNVWPGVRFDADTEVIVGFVWPW